MSYFWFFFSMAKPYNLTHTVPNCMPFVCIYTQFKHQRRASKKENILREAHSKVECHKIPVLSHLCVACRKSSGNHLVRIFYHHLVSTCQAHGVYSMRIIYIRISLHQHPLNVKIELYFFVHGNGWMHGRVANKKFH